MLICIVLPRIHPVCAFALSSYKSQHFNGLPPLKISCLSLPDGHPLFSIPCSLFVQIAGVGGPSFANHPLNHRFSNRSFSPTYKPLFSATPLFSHLSALPGGGGGTVCKFLSAGSKAGHVPRRKRKIHAIMWPADGPGDRWSRAIGTGGKSGHRRRRLARAGDEVGQRAW